MLQRDFILGWKNIKREDYVGASSGYSRKQACVGTTNGAGGRNIQIFVLTPDLVVLHALPGFWHPEDLARELQLAKAIWRLWSDKSRTKEEKVSMYQRLQLIELRYQPPATYARSDYQEFDKHHAGRAHKKDGDTFERSADGKRKLTPRGAPVLKPLNVLVHERMAARPFLPFKDFDVDRFIDYGRSYYDNNVGVDGPGKKL